MKLTLDTNILIMCDQDKDIQSIFEAKKIGSVSLYGSHRLYMEAKSEVAQKKLNDIINISEPGIIGFSFIGHCYITSNESKELTFLEIVQILYPTRKKLDPNNVEDFRKAHDVMHLMAHTHAKNDIFVTLDTKDFIKNGKQAALDSVGVIVKTPIEVCELLSK